jgi:hypothetical protein
MTTKTPPESPAAPSTIEDRLEAQVAKLTAADASEHAAALQPWLDSVASARAQIEPLRRQLEAVRLSEEPTMLRRQEILKNPKVGRLKGNRIGDTVEWTRRAVADWLGGLASGFTQLANATQAYEELSAGLVTPDTIRLRPWQTARVLDNVRYAETNLHHCERTLEGIAANMAIITAALDRGHFEPDRSLVVAKEYQPGPEAA